MFIAINVHSYVWLLNSNAGHKPNTGEGRSRVAFYFEFTNLALTKCRQSYSVDIYNGRCWRGINKEVGLDWTEIFVQIPELSRPDDLVERSAPPKQGNQGHRSAIFARNWIFQFRFIMKVTHLTLIYVNGLLSCCYHKNSPVMISLIVIFVFGPFQTRWR